MCLHPFCVLCVCPPVLFWKERIVARKEVVQYTDDMTGAPLESGKVVEVELSYRGRDYVLDLSHESSLELATVLDPWLSVARRVPRSSQRQGPSLATKERNRAIRAWARDNGYEVSDRGAIAKGVIAAYDEAQSM